MNSYEAIRDIDVTRVGSDPAFRIKVRFHDKAEPIDVTVGVNQETVTVADALNCVAVGFRRIAEALGAAQKAADASKILVTNEMPKVVQFGRKR